MTETMDIRKHTVPDFLGRDTEDRIIPCIEEVLDNIRKRGLFFIDRKECVTGYGETEFYDWDLYFECLFLSYVGVYKYCRNNIELFLDRQSPEGFVSRTIRQPRTRHHFKPFLAQTALLGCRQSNDFRWLMGERYYDRMKKYLQYWFSFCDADGNGLCYWNGADASGMDNQVRRLGGFDADEYEGVDLNCYLVRELDAMAEIALEIGNEDDADEYSAHADSLRKLINDTFWDEKDGFYYDRSEKTGEFNRILSVAGFMPLWAKAASPERAERIIREHLTNENEFWLKYPVATWSKTEPDYCQEKNGGGCPWTGTAWVPTNYMVFRGLVDYGYKDIAVAIADKTFELVISEQFLREYYDAETGAGFGRSPFWGWSSLGYIMKAESDLGISHSDVHNRDFTVIDGVRL